MGYYKERHLVKTELQYAISRELSPSMGYTVRMAQADLDRLTGPGAFWILGDSAVGYAIYEKGNGRSTHIYYPVRDLVVLAVEQWRRGHDKSGNRLPVDGEPWAVERCQCESSHCQHGEDPCWQEAVDRVSPSFNMCAGCAKAFRAYLESLKVAR